MIKTVLTFIFVFGLIVVVHEFGHYYFAKKSGIMVREFSIGMGPKLLSFHKNNTTYTLRLLPIGGYVRMAGLGEDSDDLQKGMQVTIQLNERDEVVLINTNQRQHIEGIPLQVTDFDLVDQLFIQGFVMGDETQNQRYVVHHDAFIIEEDGTKLQIAPRDVQFDAARLPHRMLTNIAGPLNNFILAIILFMMVAFMQGGVPATEETNIMVDSKAPAAMAGIKNHAEILAINQQKVHNWEEITQVISQSKSNIAIKVKQEGETKTMNVKPKYIREDGKRRALIGIRPAMNESLWAKLKYGFTATIDNSLSIFKALGNLFTDFSLNKLGGPVAIFKMSETVANSGVIMVLSFTAMLSINIGIINLLPIPALDGGKLVLNIYEAVRGKPLDPKKEGILTAIGFALVMILMILVTWNDIQRYFFK